VSGRRTVRSASPLPAVFAVLLGCSVGAPPESPAAAAAWGLPELGATTREHWESVRRPELRSLFEHHVYGRVPSDLGAPAFEIESTRADALGGLATRRIVRVTLPRHPAWAGIEVMVYVPNDRSRPAPCFVGLNFGGNHAVSPEPDVPVSTRWMRASRDGRVVDHRATEVGRGASSSRWPLQTILGHGFALATAYYGDVEPDHPEGWRDGLRGAVGAAAAARGEWGAIAAWAQGLRLIADYLATDPAIDAGRLAVIGHSRLGKTALWAGAQDPRFGLVVSNDSGEGGAALMRRPVGETTARITSTFPHWFTSTYTDYADDPSRCPVDQHMLIALIAPRRAYVASAIEDTWADPEGEFLAALCATPAWALYGLEGVGVVDWPAVDTPVGRCVGYHVRTGRHDLTAYDWARYLDFAERVWAER